MIKSKRAHQNISLFLRGYVPEETRRQVISYMLPSAYFCLWFPFTVFPAFLLPLYFFSFYFYGVYIRSVYDHHMHAFTFYIVQMIFLLKKTNKIVLLNLFVRWNVQKIKDLFLFFYFHHNFVV